MTILYYETLIVIINDINKRPFTDNRQWGLKNLFLNLQRWKSAQKRSPYIILVATKLWNQLWISLEQILSWLLALVKMQFKPSISFGISVTRKINATSMTRLGDFWNFLGTKFLTKIAQMCGDSLGYFVKHHFGIKNCWDYFLIQHLVTLDATVEIIHIFRVLVFT